MNNSVALAIKITADGKDAQAGIDGVTQKTSKMGKVSKAAGRLLAAGLLAGVAAAGAAVKAAAEDEAAQVKLASALRNSAGAREKDIASVEKWIEKQGRALGVADDQLRPALESLVSSTKNVGKAQELAGLAMDISARKGESLEAVSKKLAKAYATGNVAALSRYGVATKDAEGKTRSFQQVQKALQKNYKGAAKDASDTAAGAMKKLSVRVDELKEKYGAKLLPVLLKAADAGLKVVDWIDKNEQKAKVIAATLVGLVAAVASINVAMKVWTAVTKAATAVQAAFNVVMALNPAVLVVAAVVALGVALVVAYKRSETFRNAVNRAFEAVGKAVGKVVTFIKDNWQKMLIAMTGPLGVAVVLIVSKWDTISSKAQAAWDKIKNGFSAVKTKLDEIAEGIKGTVSGAFTSLLGPIQSVIDRVQSLYNSLKSLLNYDGGGSPQAPAAPPGSVPGQSGPTTARFARGGNTYVTVSVPAGFVGDEAKLVRSLEDMFARNGRRLRGAA